MIARTRAVLMLALAVAVGCSTAPPGREAQEELVRRASAALEDWDRETPGVGGYARRGHGYAMFPEIAKGGVGLGAAYGRGVVWSQGRHIGYADVLHGSLGLQLGGQAYQQLVVFESEAALERFKQGRLDFSADSSGVFITEGYAAHVRFVDGATMFLRPIGGAMGEASFGFQRFAFVAATSP